MSIDIDWENLTTGPNGTQLAESIRIFIHNKFQQIALPQFIKSVEVHSFEFGKECPSVKLRDVCDPLPDFYEDDEEDEEQDKEEEDGRNISNFKSRNPHVVEVNRVSAEESLNQRRLAGPSDHVYNPGVVGRGSQQPSFIDTRLPISRSNLSFVDQITTPLLARSSTPGISGGTSNLGYFHLPLSAGLSGTQTPLAAVASGTSYFAALQDYHAPPWEHYLRRPPPLQPASNSVNEARSYADPSTRPSTARSYAQSPYELARDESLDGTDQLPSNSANNLPDPMDVQIVLQIQYSGDIRLSLTAEILLDYPMASFVGIPLKLNITGLSFDGVALIAYLRKRAHFCFLGQDDAEALGGVDALSQGTARQRHDSVGSKGPERRDKSGGLLRDIRVESEIGQKEVGKQVLKNVGKVEKFVLDQVQRVFEDEFVYPSFWTFLV